MSEFDADASIKGKDFLTPPHTNNHHLARWETKALFHAELLDPGPSATSSTLKFLIGF